VAHALQRCAIPARDGGRWLGRTLRRDWDKVYECPRQPLSTSWSVGPGEARDSFQTERDARVTPRDEWSAAQEWVARGGRGVAVTSSGHLALTVSLTSV